MSPDVDGMMWLGVLHWPEVMLGVWQTQVKHDSKLIFKNRQHILNLLYLRKARLLVNSYHRFILVPTDTWRNDDALITSSLRRNDVGDAFGRNEDVIVASCACWDVYSSRPQTQDWLDSSLVAKRDSWTSNVRVPACSNVEINAFCEKQAFNKCTLWNCYATIHFIEYHCWPFTQLTTPLFVYPKICQDTIMFTWVQQWK